MKTNIFLAVILFFLLSFSGYAQQEYNKFGFEINAGPSYMLNKIVGEKANLGFGFEGFVKYNFMPHLGVYAGWGWNKFQSDKSSFGNDVDYEGNGYSFGLHFLHPLQNSSFSYFLRVGGLYNHIEIESADGKIKENTKLGLGFELAAGLTYAVSSNTDIVFGLKFKSLSRDLSLGSGSKTIDYNYTGIMIGVHKTL